MHLTDVLKVIQYSRNYMKLNIDAPQRREALRRTLQCFDDNVSSHNYRIGVLASDDYGNPCTVLVLNVCEVAFCRTFNLSRYSLDNLTIR
jgi:hypothetical protein